MDKNLNSILKLECDLSNLDPGKLIKSEIWLRTHNIIKLKTVFTDKLQVINVVFETKSGFLISFHKTLNNNYNIYIIHKAAHIDEVIFYINAIKKIKI